MKKVLKFIGIRVASGMASRAGSWMWDHVIVKKMHDLKFNSARK